MNLYIYINEYLFVTLKFVTNMQQFLVDNNFLFLRSITWESHA